MDTCLQYRFYEVKWYINTYNVAERVTYCFLECACLFVFHRMLLDFLRTNLTVAPITASVARVAFRTSVCK
jgi:hypothetical protein